MRIVSGTHKSRRITPPNGLPVRPTTDLAKESLFNILNNRIGFEEISVLDLFAGTGNISFEFASRGANEITAVELNPKCVAFIQKSAEAMGFKMISVIRTSVFTLLPVLKRQFDLIFADPPFESEDIDKLPDIIFSHKLLAPDGWLVIEHPRNVKFQLHPNFTEQRQYGKVNFSFFRNAEDQS
jgi:16S rRNA (guanine(966)-N(2))-methyltransferase RsmD